MSGLQLFQLPIEILDIIFSYLSRPDLDKLVEIDYFKSHALGHIYSSVIITGYACPDYLWDEYSSYAELNYPDTEDDPKPKFFSFKSLTDFLEQNQLPIPRHIYFDYFTDIVVVYEKNPKILQDCIIETDLFWSGCSDNPDLTKSYLQKFISLPLKIRSARSCETVHNMMLESSVQFTRKLTSASFREDFPLESFFGGNSYENLVNLEFRDYINHESVKYIPRSAKTLKCVICAPKFELTEFEFPDGLENLNIFLEDYPEEYTLNFSNLERLVDLKFAIVEGFDISTCYYKASFPRSLKRVKSPFLDIEEVKKQCPELISFDCMSVRPPDSNVKVSNFPEKLTHLHVTSSVLKNIETCENDSLAFHLNDSKRRKVEQTIKPTSIKFPKNLQSLYVTGISEFTPYQTTFHECQSLFSDKEENILQNLKSLTLFRVEKFMRIGPIPRSLTELIIFSPQHKVEILNSEFFEDLKNLTNLTLLKIECPSDSSFEYELPPKLQCFDFPNWNLCKISIRSESLKCLHLSASKFKTITSQNLQIPESLVELSIPWFSGEQFDESFRFPQNLQKLNFGIKELKRIPKLPPKLKNLRIAYDPLKTPQSDFVELPTSLEVLRLIASTKVERSISIPDVSANVERCILIPDLSHLVNLKKLYFSPSGLSSKLHVELINLDNLPKSLTDLYVNGRGAQKIIGNFTDFPNLKALNLDKNNLNDWLSPLPSGFSFSDTIESISLSGNKLDNDTVITLVSYLKDTYPNFRQLFVDPTNLPKDMHYLLMERYLVSNRTMHPVFEDPLEMLHNHF